jgi:hypothetical protein
MKATNKLRFVERKVYVSKPVYNSYGDRGEVSELVKKTILQQFWEHPDGKEVCGDIFRPAHGEWRDVPVEVQA